MREGSGSRVGCSVLDGDTSEVVFCAVGIAVVAMVTGSVDSSEPPQPLRSAAATAMAISHLKVAPFGRRVCFAPTKRAHPIRSVPREENPPSASLICCREFGAL